MSRPDCRLGRSQVRSPVVRDHPDFKRLSFFDSLFFYFIDNECRVPIVDWDGRRFEVP
jgi:hypothetical protein